MPSAPTLHLTRLFSSADCPPKDQITWEQRDATIMGMDGSIVFQQKGVRVPEFWSDTALTIATQKYFRGALGAPDRERGVDQLVERVVNTIAKWGVEDGYLSRETGDLFRDELEWLCLNQYGAFNSPVWFNVGTEETPQCSACFILKVEDELDSILKLAHTEAMIFQGGSGSGINFSALRSSKESLSGGGMASGPVCFMRGFDSFAGVIKSGGKTRRAAKMVILNADHPDILTFIDSKIREEEKARALVREGYDGSFDGEAYSSIFFQNANHSVRVTDSFMNAVIQNEEIELRGVSDGKIYDRLPARTIWSAIADAAHKCGDPGLQFDTTINNWHTCPNSGRINASNPCSEFMFLDESACNLASLNLLKFLDSDGTFQTERFVRASELFILAMDIIVDRASYPTQAIQRNSRKFRPLGLGYTNLGGLLMSLGMGYDSEAGRNYAGAVTALMTGAAFRMSARLANEVKGPFEAYPENEAPFKEVLKQHMAHLNTIQEDTCTPILQGARQVWEEAAKLTRQGGLRNAQVSLLAPTGTIGFLMDSDSTGVEPMIALVIYKRLVGGGSLKLVTSSIAPALKTLGYSREQQKAILDHLQVEGTMESAPHLREEHLGVFDTALRAPGGTRTISYMAHLKMMAAVQPFLSGAISKTVNLPADTTPEEIYDIHIKAWEMGLKSVAIYREGSKGTEPLSTSKEEKSTTPDTPQDDSPSPRRARRKRLPDERLSVTHKFEVGGHEGYLTVGYYEDGRPGELFIAMAKEGSTISGLMDTFAIAISVALQHGVPLDLFCEKFRHSRFEPSGMTINPDIPVASSLVDYIFRWLSLHHSNGINTSIARIHGNQEAPSPSPFALAETSCEGEQYMGEYVPSSDAPICPDCGFVMVRNGACHKCMNCGSTSGCS